jgi:uncharacterized protein
MPWSKQRTARGAGLTANGRAVLLAAVLLSAALPDFALDLKSLKPQGYVSDFAGVVDPESKAELERYAAAVEKSTGAQMSFVTLESLEGEPLEDVSIDLFRQFGVGKKGQDNGVQILLVTRDRRSRLEVGNGLEPMLPDGLDGQILLDMRPALREGQYGEAFLQGARRIGQTIAQEKGVAIQPPTIPQAAAHHHETSLPWPLIIFGILFLVWVFRRGRRGPRGPGGGFWPGFFIGNMAGGGWGSRGGFGGSGSGWGGGGFGNSGGGFGGFGGGDAGGGGASSNW